MALHCSGPTTAPWFPSSRFPSGPHTAWFGLIPGCYLNLVIRCQFPLTEFFFPYSLHHPFLLVFFPPVSGFHHGLCVLSLTGSEEPLGMFFFLPFQGGPLSGFRSLGGRTPLGMDFFGWRYGISPSPTLLPFPADILSSVLCYATFASFFCAAGCCLSK